MDIILVCLLSVLSEKSLKLQCILKSKWLERSNIASI